MDKDQCSTMCPEGPCCVKPPHIGKEHRAGSIEQRAYARGLKDGTAQAEARIVAWLRAGKGRLYRENLADAIERGEHAKGAT